MKIENSYFKLQLILLSLELFKLIFSSNNSHITQTNCHCFFIINNPGTLINII